MMEQAAFTLDEYGYSSEPAFFDWCLGQSIHALIESGKDEAAARLLASSILLQDRGVNHRGRKIVLPVLIAPYSIITELSQTEIAQDDSGNYLIDEEGEYLIALNEHLIEISKVLELLLGCSIYLKAWDFKIQQTDLSSNWREELLEIARKKGTTNQGRSLSSEKSPIYQYANLSFRSQSEIRIARALDSKGIMYFANCTARVNRGTDRVNREPDFLVCHGGKWGILEVDGEPFHTPTNVAQDHERDRLFEHHGVRFVQHYQAQRCYQEPDQVVTEFLELLAKNG